jgi:hypothetical protein
MSKLDGSDARNDAFYRPLFSQNVEKFEARGADINAVSNGIRNL